MLAKLITAAAVSTVLALSVTVLAQQQFGTAAEAKAMLMKTVAAVQADKARALDMFAKGEGGFLDRDLYPFCFNARDGSVHPFANPNGKQFFGQDERAVKDVTGKAYGLELYNAAQKPEGEITEISYLFARPNDPTPLPKVAFVTRVADLGCAVGYSSRPKLGMRGSTGTLTGLVAD